ncbi:MAG: archease [Candidatus Hadarchaeia archaeon]
MSDEEKYEWIDHPADEGFRAYGNDLNEAFENAALALNDIMVNVGNVEGIEEIKVELEARDREALLFDWLDEFLYYYDSQGLVFSEFEVSELEEIDQGYRLVGKARGEKFDPDKHGYGTGVKAITYHMMEIEENDVCMVQVVVDV